MSPMATGAVGSTSGPPPGVARGAAAEAAPPFRLPGEHFTAGILFLTAGAVGLVLVAPELARGLHLSPRVVAVTHLFTLGWITTSIMGALYQFLPVAVGPSIRSVRLAHVSFWLYVPGLAGFVGGMASGWSVAMIAGALLFCSGLVLFLANLGLTLAAANRHDVTWWALACAAVFLGVTVILGLALTGNLYWGYLGADRLTALGAHIHVALAGWVLLVMIGVAQRLLPMFLLSHGVGSRLARLAIVLVASGAGILAGLHHGPPLVSVWLPAVLLAGGLIAFLAQARAFYTHRHRPKVDAGMKLAGSGLLLLVGGLLLAPFVFLGPPSPRIVTAYGAALVLGMSLFVAGHYYKIVPFLVWYHRFGPLAGMQKVPGVSDLYSRRWADVALVLLLAGALGMVLAVLAGSGPAAVSAALVFLAGAGTEAIQMGLLSRRAP